MLFRLIQILSIYLWLQEEIFRMSRLKKFRNSMCNLSLYQWQKHYCCMLSKKLFHCGKTLLVFCLDLYDLLTNIVQSIPPIPIWDKWRLCCRRQLPSTWQPTVTSYLLLYYTLDACSRLRFTMKINLGTLKRPDVLNNNSMSAAQVEKFRARIARESYISCQKGNYDEIYFWK